MFSALVIQELLGESIIKYLSSLHMAIKSTIYKAHLAIANIDIPSFYTASGICDTDVTAYGSTTIDVMDCNAIIDTSSPVIDNVREFLKGCRGYLPYVGGKYKLIVEYAFNGYCQPSISLSSGNII